MAARRARTDLPALPLPSDEIMREPMWQALDATGRGVLMSLLMLSWRDAALVADPLVAARLAGLDSVVCQQYWDILSPWFMPHPSRPGHLFPPCLLAGLVSLTKRRMNMLKANKANPMKALAVPATADSLSKSMRELSRMASSLGLDIS